MTIFFVAPDLRSLGGFEGQISALTSGLCQAGHSVTVVFREPVRSDHPYVRRMEAAGVRLVYPASWIRLFDPTQPNRRLIRSALVLLAAPVLGVLAIGDSLTRDRPILRSMRGVRGRWHQLVSRVLFVDVLTWNLMRVLDRERHRNTPDIIDVQHSMVPRGIEYARSRDLAVVYTEYGAPSEELESVWIGLRPFVNSADFIIGRAEASISGLRNLCGLAVERPWALVPNAVSAGPANTAALELPPDDIVVISVIGRLSPEKGTKYAVEAFRQLRVQGLPVRLVLAGDGPLRESLEYQVAEAGIADSVTFTGIFDALAPIMSITHIVAHPTENDGRSVSVLEAMAWGRPVVATAVGGVAEIVRHGETGLLVPPADPDALARALRQLVSDATLRRQMGRAAREAFVAGGFSHEEMVSRTLAVYREVLARRSTTARESLAA